MQGLKLRQMTLLVAGLVAIAIALLVADYPVAAGSSWLWRPSSRNWSWLLLFWLVIWTLADWRRRYRLAASFLVTMAILCGGLGVVPAALDSPLLAGDSRISSLHRGNVGDGRTDGRSLEPGLRTPGLRAMIGACWRDAGKRRAAALLRSR